MFKPKVLDIDCEYVVTWQCFSHGVGHSWDTEPQQSKADNQQTADSIQPTTPWTSHRRKCSVGLPLEIRSARRNETGDRNGRRTYGSHRDLETWGPAMPATDMNVIARQQSSGVDKSVVQRMRRRGQCHIDDLGSGATFAAVAGNAPGGREQVGASRGPSLGPAHARRYTANLQLLGCHTLL